jgi:hypothetical protein
MNKLRTKAKMGWICDTPYDRIFFIFVYNLNMNQYQTYEQSIH